VWANKILSGGCIMQLKINTKQFTNAVKNCNSFKSKSRSALPILRQVMLKALDNQLTIYSTDLDIYTVFTIPADVQEEEGIILVNHKKLLDILKAIKDKEITIKTEKDYLFIDNTKLKIDLEPDDFPLPEAFPSDLAVSISGKELLKGISKTIYAVSKDESRFALNGVCFSFIKGKLDFVATDGHRLALYTTDISEKKYEGKYIISEKVFKTLKNLVKQSSDVEFAIKNEFAFFKIDNAIIQVKLTEGVFPDYYQVIPEQFNIELKLDRYLFTEILSEVISVIENKDKPIILTLKDNKLTVANAYDEDVSIERFIAYKTYSDFRIGFNGKYLFEAINCIDSRNVIVKFIDKDSQAVITPENTEERYIAVVMPMNI
jgi:DNA polymerase-3 subunit beta